MRKLQILLLFVLSTTFLSAQETFNLNDRVEAEDKGAWYKATIIRGKSGQHFKDGKYFIHWDGYAASYDVWIEPAKLRKMGSAKNVATNASNTSSNNVPVTTPTTTATSPTTTVATTSPAVAGQYKIGDKVTLMDTGFPDGTITGVKGKDYIIDIADPYYTAYGKQGVSANSIRPQWQYKAFSEELKALQENASKATKGKFGTIKDIAKMVCQDCSPNGNANMEQTTEFVNTAKNDMAQLKALVKKHEPLPDNGNKLFDRNPALVAKVVAESDKIIATLTANAFKDKIRSWFTADMYFYDLTFDSFDTEHVLLNGVSFQDFAMCGSINDVKPALIKNLEACITKYGLTGKPEDYLEGFDKNWEERKAKLIASAEDISWVKSDYPISDNSLNALIGNNNMKIMKVFFNQTGYTINYDDYGNITDQSRGGVVFYQKPGCTYWKYFLITAYKTYIGGGKYKATEITFYDPLFIKPF